MNLTWGRLLPDLFSFTLRLCHLPYPHGVSSSWSSHSQRGYPGLPVPWWLQMDLTGELHLQGIGKKCVRKSSGAVESLSVPRLLSALSQGLTQDFYFLSVTAWPTASSCSDWTWVRLCTPSLPLWHPHTLPWICLLSESMLQREPSLQSSLCPSRWACLSLYSTCLLFPMESGNVPHFRR